MDGAPDLTAFILAGGKSSRMGKDKAFVEFEGRTLLARALDLAASVASEVCIVGRREKFAAFAPVVEDVFRECGPLGGIHAALRHSKTDINLMLAVDTPLLSWALLQYLIREAEKSAEVAAVVPRGKEGWQPLCAIYRREFADAAEEALRAGQNKIGWLLDKVRVRAIEQEELDRAGFSPAIFRNLNTPEELKEVQRSGSFS
jgi:molybdopterin-guanine dinucleotide biosynthesis protein A